MWDGLKQSMHLRLDNDSDTHTRFLASDSTDRADKHPRQKKFDLPLAADHCISIY